MNNNRRARLSMCASNLQTLKYYAEDAKEAIDKLISLKSELDSWSKQVDSISSSLEDIETEEQAALDSIPDSFQMGDIANSIEDALFEIGNAKDETGALKQNIDEIEETYISTFLPGFSPNSLMDKLDSFMDDIDVAIDSIKEAKA